MKMTFLLTFRNLFRVKLGCIATRVELTRKPALLAAGLVVLTGRLTMRGYSGMLKCLVDCGCSQSFFFESQLGNVEWPIIICKPSLD